MNDELGRTENKTVIPCFKVLRQYLFRETEKSHTVSIVTIATLQAKNQFSDFWYEK